MQNDRAFKCSMCGEYHYEDKLAAQLCEDCASKQGESKPTAHNSDYAKLKEITEIAHCGGLRGMSESDALTAIRKLTVDVFRFNFA